MSIRSDVDVVKAAYSAFGAGDVQKLLSLMTSDIVWEFPASKVIPGPASSQVRQKSAVSLQR